MQTIKISAATQAFFPNLTLLYPVILFYTPHTSNRLRYMVSCMELFAGFGEVLITGSSTEFISHPGPKINYSDQPLAETEVWIKPSGLLVEKGIHDREIACFDNGNYPAFFKTGGILGFDILSASFYLLSRYEEYLPREKDMYGRYDHIHSIAFKNNFLNRPLVNTWFEDLKARVKEKHPLAQFSYSPFQFLPTYDIDIAWSYRNKGLWRNTGGFFRSLFWGKWKEAGLRIKVLSGKQPDPFDVFTLMDEWHKTYSLKPVYFFPLAEKTGQYDKNISPYNSKYRKLIREHAQQYTTGIHPSWQSGDDINKLSREIKLLENITGNKIARSRQHYIRMRLPDTYRRLIQHGITEDYSMGYGGINGFRASVATPFYWYDLEREEQTSLLLHPFCFMDANSFFEQKQTPQEAYDELLHYYTEVKKVQGQCCMIWHHPFFGTDPLFSGWREVYEQFIRENEFTG